MNRGAWLALVLGAFSLTGCAGGYAFYAATPPPPLRVEARGFAPEPGFVWVDGFWAVRGGGYVWEPGRWARPPRARAVWAPGRWDQRGGRYYYREGRWR
jgi:hypothetical protein